MKIVFWSCFPGHAHVTSNMVACALSSAIDHNYSVSLMQMQYRNNNLQGCFIADSAVESINNEYYQDTGIDSLIRNVVAGSTTKDQIISCSYSFLNQKLSLYAKTTANNSNVYYKDLTSVLSKVLIDVDDAFDISFIDTLAGANQLSSDVISEADMVVVCLPQCKWIIDYFFSAYKIEADNLFYVFGDYDPDKKLNLKTLQKMYKKKFTKDNCAFILHNPEYSDAMDNHSVISFYLAHRSVGKSKGKLSSILSSNSKTEKKDANAAFMQSVRNCTIKMLRHAGVKVYEDGDD